MDAPARVLLLRRRLAAWSDHAQHDAATLAEKHRDLLPRQITNAQLSGLQNIVQVAPTFNDIRRYVKNQGDKASRAGRDYVADYWKDVQKSLEALRQEAKPLLSSVPASPESATPVDKSTADAWHCRLAREFVQHLVAHSRYLPMSGR